MKTDAIIFDLDGTLWETLDSTYEATKEVTSKYNLDEITKETISKCMGMTKKECAKTYYPNLELKKAEALLKEGLEINNKRLEKYGGNVYPGLEKTLKELKNDYKLAIVSNCAAGYIESFLKSSGLEIYFDDFLAAGQLGLEKKEAIKEIIKRNDLKNAVYVGDTIRDKEAAIGANIEFIHAKYGFDQNLEHKYQIENISDLPKYLKTINK